MGDAVSENANWEAAMNLVDRAFGDVFLRAEPSEWPTSTMDYYRKVDEYVRRIPDSEIRKIRGIGPKRLAALRVELPYTPEEDA